MPAIYAQNYLNDEEDYDSKSYLQNNNPTLFVNRSELFQPINNTSALYDEITKYTYAPISTKRRGVERWYYDRIYSSENILDRRFNPLIPSGEIKLFSTNSTYRFGAEAQWATPIGHGWSVEFTAQGRTGRDGAIKGVFEQSITPEIGITKEFGAQHFLHLDIQSPYIMRGLRSSAVQECYDLLHNNLYNPSWGYYKGEIRNSRVLRSFIPTLNALYARPLSVTTNLAVALDYKWGHRRVSQLGWYNSSTPLPSYYTKLPSYYYGSTSYSTIYDSWQQNDTDYTQINWDRLEVVNLLSEDGQARFVVEDQVVRYSDIDLKVMFRSNLSDNLEVDYGAIFSYSSHRKYKQMRDLLGSTYLLDIDQYIDDDTHSSTNLQNDLRNPNRKISTDDRFGYDFALRTSTLGASGGVRYNSSRIAITADATFVTQNITRHGFYEKGRFPGAGSYGDSQKVEFSTYNISFGATYKFKNLRHQLQICGALDSSAPIAKYIFIAEENSNYIIDSPTTEKIVSGCVNYTFTTSKVTLTAQAFVIDISDLAQVREGYDDLSSTYCNIVISDIATRSLGVEIALRARLSYRVALTSTLAVVGGEYTSAPLVKLYDQEDLSLVATSRASSLKGFVVGNTPQLTTTVGATFFAGRGFTIGAHGAYYAMRYIAPSLQRRTDRILARATSAEMLQQMTTQEQLSDMVNLSLSLNKKFNIGQNAISLFAKVDNILATNNIELFGYEGNRMLSNYSGYSPQGSSYQYSRGRTIYISATYRF